uniref:Astacin domain-containing protein n=1 Tax=Meloidogyne hapla TaxID=6305 RepID=A0A1I8BV15_MELHA
MHALGLHHEQARGDRNESDARHNFHRYKTLNFGIPYDFGSVMHYKPISKFNKDMNKYAIVALKHDYQNTFGQRVGPSFKDLKIINRIYCTTDYPHHALAYRSDPISINFGCEIKEYELNGGKCKNGGYPNPLENCVCRCPEGYGGDYCTDYECNC